MSQYCYLKTTAGNMNIQEIMITSPDGKVFTYNSRLGLMTYNSATGVNFTDLLANSWLTDADKANVKVIALALTDNKNFLRNLEKFK